MSESEHPYVEWIAREARRPVEMDRAARDRIMAAVRMEGAHRPSAVRHWWSRLTEPRVVRLSPMFTGLAAAGLVVAGVLAGGLTNWGVRKDGRPMADAAMQPPVTHSTDTVVKFVFAGPRASRVSLVGDFNGWDATRTPMSRDPKTGDWTVALPLNAGRYVYAFVVDGTTWANDPSAPLAPDDGFGHASSVKNVPGPTL
jgi:anti-sigma factor RsiW